MTGARAFAIDFLRRALKPRNGALLDVGTGDGEIAKLIRNWTQSRLLAVDINTERLPKEPGFEIRSVKEVPWLWGISNFYDIVISTYALHTLNESETAVWAEIGRVLKPGGVLAITSNYSEKAPFMSRHRGDPLKVDNEVTLSTLAIASGLRPLSFELAYYEAHQYRAAKAAEATAIGGLFVKDAEQYTSTLPK